MTSHNAKASHLYRDGHVTHNSHQLAFLQEVYDKEDFLRQDVEFYGSFKPKRTNFLDWRDPFIPNSARSSVSSFGTLTSRSGRPETSSTTSASGGNYTARTRSTRDGSSTYRSCNGSLTSRSSLNSSAASSLSTSRSSTCRSDVASSIGKLRARRRKLQAEIKAIDSILSASYPSLKPRTAKKQARRDKRQELDPRVGGKQ